MRHNPDHGIMTEFVQLGPVPVDRLEIRLLRRNLDEVVARRIERHLAANANVRSGRSDDRFNLREYFCASRKRRRIRISGQPLTLFGMEDGEPLQEADAAGVFAGRARLLLLCFGNEGVSIDNHRPLLALAYIAAESERLFESEPELRGSPLLDRGGPEQENVDPGIGSSGRCVLGQTERRPS